MRVNRASLPCDFIGGPGRSRTFDACAFNAALCQLSYQSKNLFRQHSQRTTPYVAPTTLARRWHIRPSPVPGLSQVEQELRDGLACKHCRNRAGTHTLYPSGSPNRSQHNYFAGIGTAVLAHNRVGPDTRHDTNFLKITCRCVDALLAWPCEGPENKKPGPLASNRVACEQTGDSYTLPPPGLNEFSKSLPMEMVLAIALDV